jgi:hypothetical protein
LVFCSVVKVKGENAMPLRTDQVDEAVLSCIGSEPVSIVDLCSNGGRIGAYRNSLRRLLEQEAVQRKWDGNQRFGRYLYFRRTQE